MSTLASNRVWQKRLEEIDDRVRRIVLPDPADVEDADQDQEWCEVVTDSQRKRIRFHDYKEVFRIPGLYERLFYDRLQCCSPSYVVNLLEDVAEEWGVELPELNVLDLGAGNGMVGDELRHRGVSTIVGVDIIPEARQATLRDRPGVYDDYMVCDLAELPPENETALRRHRFDLLSSVAALGYGDVPPAAFLKALDLLSTPAWLAFNIKETFLQETDTSGFSRLIRHLMQEGCIRPYCYRRYRHRMSVAGKPLYYVAMVAQKIRPIPDAVLDH